MKKRILEISLINHIKNLSWLFFFILVYYVLIFFSYEEINFKFWAIHFLISLFIIPTMYIHLQYWLNNRGNRYIINSTFIQDDKKNINYPNNEISKIIIHKSESLQSGKWAYFPFQHYKYCEVLLKDGRKIILTSLLHYNIDEYLKENLRGVLFENDDNSFSYFL